MTDEKPKKKPKKSDRVVYAIRHNHLCIHSIRGACMLAFHVGRQICKYYACWFVHASYKPSFLAQVPSFGPPTCSTPPNGADFSDRSSQGESSVILGQMSANHHDDCHPSAARSHRSTGSTDQASQKAPARFPQLPRSPPLIASSALIGQRHPTSLITAHTTRLPVTSVSITTWFFPARPLP